MSNKVPLTYCKLASIGLLLFSGVTLQWFMTALSDAAENITTKPAVAAPTPSSSPSATPLAKMNFADDPFADPSDRYFLRTYERELKADVREPQHEQALYVLDKLQASFEAMGFAQQAEHAISSQGGPWVESKLYPIYKSIFAEKYTDFNQLHDLLRIYSNNLQRYLLDWYKVHPDEYLDYLHYRYAAFNNAEKSKLYYQDKVEKVTNHFLFDYFTSTQSPAKQLYSQAQLSALYPLFVKHVSSCVIFSTPSIERCSASMINHEATRYVYELRLPEFRLIMDLTGKVRILVEKATTSSRVFRGDEAAVIDSHLLELIRDRFDFKVAQTKINRNLDGQILDSNTIWDYDNYQGAEHIEEFKAFDDKLKLVEDDNGDKHAVLDTAVPAPKTTSSSAKTSSKSVKISSNSKTRKSSKTHRKTNK